MFPKKWCRNVCLLLFELKLQLIWTIEKKVTKKQEILKEGLKRNGELKSRGGLRKVV